MTTTDLKKTFASLYNPSTKEVSVVDVPAFNFLMLDGAGDPNTAPAYAQALEALYGVAYTLKFMLKARGAPDFTVMPLEGLWWSDDMDDFIAGRKDRWSWTAMIMQPDSITAEQVQEAAGELRRKKNPPALDKLRFESYTEGLAAQIMHIGSYSAEAPNILRIHQFIEEHGYARSGKHHEIYLGDPRRSAPEKLKTVIRQPMRKAM